MSIIRNIKTGLTSLAQPDFLPQPGVLLAQHRALCQSQVRHSQSCDLEATDKLHSQALSGKGITYILYLARCFSLMT